MGYSEISRSIHIGRDALGNVLVTGDGNNVRVTLVVADQRLLSSLTTNDHDQILTNPFRGLDAFYESDAKFFFGRSKLIRRTWLLFQKLQQENGPRILAVVGASGSGKSSLVRAGLVPELAREPMQGLESPKVLILRPGSNPLNRLFDVVGQLETGEKSHDTNLFESASGLHSSIVSASKSFERSRFVVIVDQYEELFTECTDPVQRDRFLDNLAYAASQPDKLVSIILTLRSDFAGAVRTPETFARAVREQRLVVQAMNRQEIEEAITKPAEALGHPWPVPIVENLVLQAEGRAGALPLLQFTLKRIWPSNIASRLADSSLSSRLIEDFLVEAADALFDIAVKSYDGAGQRIIRRAFLAMVQLGEGTADTRRVARLSELVGARDNEEHVRGVLMPFTAPEARLLITSEQGEEPTYELAHEALIASWDKLRFWLGNVADKVEGERVRSDIRLYRRLASAALDWKKGTGGPWRKPELDFLLDYVTRHPLDLTTTERDFLNASVSEMEKAADEVRQAQDREIRAAHALAAAAQQISRRTRNTALALSVLSTVAIGLGVAAYSYAEKESDARRDAEHQTQLALDARDSAEIAQVSAEAGRREAAISAIASTTDKLRKATSSLDSLAEAITLTKLSFDAQGAPQQELQVALKRIVSSRLSKRPSDWLASEIHTADVAPNFAGIYLGLQNGDVLEFSPGQRSSPRTVMRLESAASFLQANNVRRIVVAAEKSGTMGIFDPKTGTSHVVKTPAKDVLAMTISPDGAVIAIGDSLGKLFLVNTQGVELATAQLESAITAVAFDSFSGLVAVGTSTALTILNVEAKILVELKDGQLNGIEAITFTPDGHYLVVSTADSKVVGISTRNLSFDAWETFSSPSQPVKALFVDGAGRSIIGITTKGEVMSWDANTKLPNLGDVYDIPTSGGLGFASDTDLVLSKDRKNNLVLSPITWRGAFYLGCFLLGRPETASDTVIPSLMQATAWCRSRAIEEQRSNRLFRAIAATDIKLLKDALSDAQLDIGIRDGFGNSALILATMANWSDGIAEILNHMPDINQVNDSGETAAFIAATRHYERALSVLSDHPTFRPHDVSRAQTPLGYRPINVKLIPASAPKEVRAGNDYEQGVGHNTSLQIAFETYQTAAEKGDMFAQYLVARMYYYGAGIDQNIDKALDLLNRSAERGEGYAINFLASVYRDGDIGPPEIQRAREMFEEAAQLGNPLAQYNLAILLLSDNDQKLLEDARRLLTESCSNGFGGSCFELASSDQVPPADRQDFLERAVEFDDVFALSEYGTDLLHRGVDQPTDFARAMELLGRAVALGSPDAALALGHHYESGGNSPQDQSLAADYMRRAASLGSPAAALRLARAYEHGILGVNESAERSIYWYHRAAALEAGSISNDARLTLALKYFVGQGVGRDLIFAKAICETTDKPYSPDEETQALRAGCELSEAQP